MNVKLGTEQRPLRVAVIGSGPSGFFAVQSLLKNELKIQVDMFERLPTPFGLVRYGVAPDHPRIKDVAQVYETIAQNPRFNFIGNVDVGTDICFSEIERYYDAIIFACGTEIDRRLGIPGEELKGCHAATDFVGWYNGNPKYADNTFDLSHDTAVIIGHGNVALDVARIMCRTIAELKTTDITKNALSVLSKSKVRNIHIVGRRGPAQASFTPAEIKIFNQLEHCHVIIAPQDLILNAASEEELNDPNNKISRKNMIIFNEYAKAAPKAAQKNIIIHFLKSPQAIEGDQHVAKVIFHVNALIGPAGKQKAQATHKKEDIPCGIFITSVGYRGVPIEGVPFDEERGLFPNVEGRMISDGKIVPKLYCVGWIKRGPFGVIGSNKVDSQQTVQNLLKDIDALSPCEMPHTESLIDLLKDKMQRQVVNFDDWKKIDDAEIRRGGEDGKPREKFIIVKDMLSNI